MNADLQDAAGRRSGAIAALVVGLLAALISLRTVSNPDVWLHLAAGREVATHGIEATIGGRRLQDVARDTLAIARKGLARRLFGCPVIVHVRSVQQPLRMRQWQGARAMKRALALPDPSPAPPGRDRFGGPRNR